MKKVLIVSRRLIRKGKTINWVSEIYLQLLAKGGVMPIIIPIAEATKKILGDYLLDYDGLLMMEGGDINPLFYGENYDINTLDEYDPLKDEIEITCLKHALENNKATIGFCRGMQLINVLHKGKIHRDVHETFNHKVHHINYDNYDTHRHKITLVEQTPLYDWYQQNELMVNSYHHQGIKQLGTGLLPMAYSEDGLIEGIYNPSLRFVVGLQFHPERMLEEYAGNKAVFEAFIQAIKEQ
ncbi:MAG: type 1 glutamine amidotransferase [Bacteroidales bacterium]|nr:type 1 glutamine amidotransferase [Bacteroidales bacterium]